MSSEPHEIIIIKRVGGHEDEHHGGVWKIAFADFMTAMMAFFLVMWLISANDKTKAVIARYFNPVQLIDSTPQPKGLEDPKAGLPNVMHKAPTALPESKDKADKAAESKAESTAAKPDEAKPSETKSEASKADAGTVAAGQSAKHEAELFADPYAVLSEIAKKDDPKPSDVAPKPQDGQNGGTGAVGLKGGAAYRDPFEPLSMPPRPLADAANELNDQQASLALPERPEASHPPATPADAPKPVAATPAAPDVKPAPTPALPEARPGTLAARIEAAVKASNVAGAGPQVDIHHTGEGTVLDVTDALGFAMFASASAEPSPKMVRMMEKIGRLLKAEKGRIVIRGFTDSRPFRSDTYDNWRLSAARAHMAHYMLVRGGLDDARIEAVEGYADRRPKNPKDPNAPENRRIEILIRDPAP